MGVDIRARVIIGDRPMPADTRCRRPDRSIAVRSILFRGARAVAVRRAARLAMKRLARDPPRSAARMSASTIAILPSRGRRRRRAFLRGAVLGSVRLVRFLRRGLSARHAAIRCEDPDVRIEKMHYESPPKT